MCDAQAFAKLIELRSNVMAINAYLLRFPKPVLPVDRGPVKRRHGIGRWVETSKAIRKAVAGKAKAIDVHSTIAISEGNSVLANRGSRSKGNAPLI
eukprot:4722935-Pleurochrysis_carterae.AAC.1